MNNNSEQQISQETQRIISLFCLCYPNFNMQKIIMLNIPESELADRIRLHISNSREEIKRLKKQVKHEINRAETISQGDMFPKVQKQKTD